jgi:hypothetical protein
MRAEGLRKCARCRWRGDLGRFFIFCAKAARADCECAGARGDTALQNVGENDILVIATPTGQRFCGLAGVVGEENPLARARDWRVFACAKGRAVAV